MRSVETLEKTTFSGRRFTRKQLARVQETVQAFPNLSRNELALTLCEHLDWCTPNGSYKVRSCLNMLEKLEAQGIVRLPAKRQTRAAKAHAIPFKQPEASVESSLEALGPILLRLVTTAEDRALWRSYVESHHYLGHKKPIGAHLFYFVVSEARQQKLGCLLYSAAAAWAMAPRDNWIGWDKQHREKCLPLVLSQNRFLIFPWVKVPNLATKVLALSSKQVGDDWVRAYHYRPVLIETFVDTTRFSGASYRAANWHYLGETQGRGRGPEHKNEKSRKAIFVYPLQADWRQCLTQGHQPRVLKKRYRNDVRSSRTRTVGESFVKLWERVVHILHEVAQEYDGKWQVRKRVLNSLLLLLLIFRLVSSKNSQSYGTTIDELWDSCNKLDISLPQPASVAPSSFCVARKKLDESIFKCANQRIIEAYAPEADNYRWLGHRLFAVDGSKLNLPRELSVYGYKTPSKNAHYPQGQLSCLYQVKSQLPFDFSLTSHTDERLCAAEHLTVLQPDDAVVYDRGYFSYVMLHQHCETGIHAIFRLQESSYNVIRDFFAGSQFDTVVEILPSKESQRDIRKQHPHIEFVPLKMRLVKYELAGNTYCLGTTLFDRDRYPLTELKEVYHARWGVEELYKVSKQIFVIEDFHGRSERGVKQELYAHFVLVTMNRLFANQSDIDLNTNDAPAVPMQRPGTTSLAVPNSLRNKIQTNFKNCVHVVARSIEELLLLQDRLTATVRRVMSRVMGRHQRQRPGRSYPRRSMKPNPKWTPSEKKTKKTKGKGKGTMPTAPATASTALA